MSSDSTGPIEHPPLGDGASDPGEPAPPAPPAPPGPDAAQVKALEDQIEKQKAANKQIEEQIAVLKDRLRADVCTAKDPQGKTPPASTPVPPGGQKT